MGLVAIGVSELLIRRFWVRIPGGALEILLWLLGYLVGFPI
jgi:hypothetical protein